MISIEMSSCQFKKVSEIIVNDHKEATVQFTGDMNGHIHTSQIDADFEYRERDDNQGTLVFLNEQKHGMYNLVSDDTIGAHISKLFTGIVCDEPTIKNDTIPIPAQPNSFVKLSTSNGASS